MLNENVDNLLYIPYSGSVLLESPLLNKGSGFSEEERVIFNLEGLLPNAVETIEEQSHRAYRQFSDFKSAIAQHIYLRNIQDTNETLFYYLVNKHLAEMLPIIYTPVLAMHANIFLIFTVGPEGYLSHGRIAIKSMIYCTMPRNSIFVSSSSPMVNGSWDLGIKVLAAWGFQSANCLCIPSAVV